MSAPPPPAPPPPAPLYLGSPGERFLALFHDVAGAAQRSAVLICPPFGWEDICSYRSRRDWAEELARAGHPALRIDLPGSGDSAGGPGDPGRVQAWTQAVAIAGGWLRERSGAPGLAVIGIGLGGMLACSAAMEGAEIDELILWAVPTLGRTLVRELRAFSRLEVAGVTEPGAAEPETAPPEEPELVANGYLMSAETVAALEALDLAALPTGQARTRRALVLGRDGLRSDERLRELLERAGASVTVADGPGYGEMMLEPQDARPPAAVFARVGEWLADAARPATAATAAPELRRTEPPAPLARPEHAAEEAAGSSEELELLSGGVQLRERAVHVERPEGRLFGVLTEPVNSRSELCAVLLNAGPQRHVGPNRMWVEIARRWAARGVPTLRIDLAAIGDSDGDAAALVRVASLYVPEYVEQVRAALDMLGERGLPERFVLLGLCSGAYWSMHAALQDERVAGIVMLNPRALIFDEWTYALRRTRNLREQMTHGSTWRRVLRGEITLARHLETARAISARALRAPQRARERLAASRHPPLAGAVANPAEGLFEALHERDQNVLLVLSGKEPLREELAPTGFFDHIARWPNVELVLTGTSADTHTLTPRWLQCEVHALVDAALERELLRLPAP
jgi:alpha-beta hydrolase superfamily lysophospholipase